MTTGKKTKALLESGDYVVAKRRVKLTTGDIVRMLREKNELTQLQLAETTGLKQNTVSAIEKNRVNIGIERAKVLAKALHVHPATIVFHDWEQEDAA